MRWKIRAALPLALLAGAAGCAPVPPASGGGTGDYSGTYCGTARTVTPGGTTSGAVTFSCSGGACADPTGSFIGSVDPGGWFSGSTQVCAACARFAMSGQMSRTTTFVLSGASGGGSSQTVTASYCGSGGGGGGGGGGGDTTAPSVPAGLTVTPSSPTRLDLSWSASTDDTGVTGYAVYRNGAVSPRQTLSGTSTSDTGLAMRTQYCYTVVAYDAAGNRSAHTAQVCATTPCEASAPTAPREPVLVWATGEHDLKISWGKSTDDTGVTGYRLYRDGAFVRTVTDPAMLQTITASDGARDRLGRSCYELEAVDGCDNVSPRTTPSCGSTAAILVSTAVNPERVKADATHVYWSEDARPLQRVSIADGLITTVASITAGSAFALDGARVYYGASPGQARSIAKDGSGPSDVLGDAGIGDFVVDATTLYTGTLGGAICTLPKAGGASTLTATSVFRLAVDAAHVYWTTYVGASGTVLRMPVGGGAVETVVPAPRHGPYGVAVDETHVYWTEDGSGGGIASVFKRPKDLGGPAVLLALRHNNPNVYAIAVDDTDVYWTESTGVRAVRKDGAHPRYVVERSDVRDVFVDGAHVFWVERFGGVIGMVPK